MTTPNPSKPCSVERVMKMVSDYAIEVQRGHVAKAVTKRTALRTQIAAMVEALERCLHRLEDHNGRCDRCVGIHCVQCQARAALTANQTTTPADAGEGVTK